MKIVVMIGVLRPCEYISLQEIFRYSHATIIKLRVKFAFVRRTRIMVPHLFFCEETFGYVSIQKKKKKENVDKCKLCFCNLKNYFLSIMNISTL